MLRRRTTTGPVVRLGAFSRPLVNLRIAVNANNHRARLYGCILARESVRERSKQQPAKCDDPCCASCNGPLHAVMKAIAEAVVKSMYDPEPESEAEPEAATLN